MKAEEIEKIAKEIIPEKLYKDCSGYVTIEDANYGIRQILIQGIKIGVESKCKELEEENKKLKEQLEKATNKNCTCPEEEKTGITTFDCCNICGKIVN